MMMRLMRSAKTSQWSQQPQKHSRATTSKTTSRANIKTPHHPPLKSPLKRAKSLREPPPQTQKEDRAGLLAVPNVSARSFTWTTLHWETHSLGRQLLRPSAAVKSAFKRVCSPCMSTSELLANTRPWVKIPYNPNPH